MTIKVGIVTFGNAKTWLGGVNYIINIIQALHSLPVRDRPYICLIVKNQDYACINKFEIISNLVNIVLAVTKASNSTELRQTKSFDEVLFSLEECYKYVDVLFPLYSPDVNKHLPHACWVPDLQDKHFREFFSAEDLILRDTRRHAILQSNRPVAFSSVTVYRDFERHYGPPRFSFILPFVSTIEENLLQTNCDDIVKRYDLPERFFICSNQFWAHKNHLTIFKAIVLLVNKQIPVKLVCTGSASDYRNIDYYLGLINFIEKNDLSSNIFILGEIKREHQIALLRCSLAVIQPSLFEGWSTVVEDAKTLGKTLLLSDIEVHREQAPADVIWFSPHDHNKLSGIMEEIFVDKSVGYSSDKEKHAAKLVKIRQQNFAKQMLLNFKKIRLRYYGFLLVKRFKFIINYKK